MEFNAVSGFAFPVEGPRDRSNLVGVKFIQRNGADYLGILLGPLGLSRLKVYHSTYNRSGQGAILCRDRQIFSSAREGLHIGVARLPDVPACRIPRDDFRK